MKNEECRMKNQIPIRQSRFTLHASRYILHSSFFIPHLLFLIFTLHASSLRTHWQNEPSLQFKRGLVIAQPSPRLNANEPSLLHHVPNGGLGVFLFFIHHSSFIIF